jgi:hypothetical protein
MYNRRNSFRNSFLDERAMEERAPSGRQALDDPLAIVSAPPPVQATPSPLKKANAINSYQASGMLDAEPRESITTPQPVEATKVKSPASFNKMRDIAPAPLLTGSEPQRITPAPTGMFGKEFKAQVDNSSPIQTATPFSEGWSDLFVADSKTYANFDRIGGMAGKKSQLEVAKNTAKQYLPETSLSFDMGESIQDKGLARERVKELNNFTNSQEYTTGLQSYMNDMSDSGLSEQELQMYYADANGIRSRTSNLEWDKGANQFKFDLHQDSALETGLKGVLVTGLTLATGQALGAVLGGAAATGSAAGSAASTGLVSGVSQATANAIGSAVVSGGVSHVQGGDLKDVLSSAAMAGFSAYSKGISEAAESAMASATLPSATKEMIQSASSLNSQAEVFNNIKTTVNLTEAIKSEDYLSALTSGLELSGLASPSKFVQDKITENFGDVEWISQNTEQLASASLKFTDKIAKGDSFEDAAQAAVLKYAKDGGGLSQLLGDMPEGSDFNLDFEIPEEFIQFLKDTGKDIDKNILQPAKLVVESVIKGAGDLIEEVTPDLGSWSKELKEIDKTILQPIKVAAESVASAVGEGASILNKEVVKPVTSTVEKGAVLLNEEVIKPTTSAIKEIGSLGNKEVLKPTLNAIKEAVPSVNLPSFDSSKMELDLPSVDTGSLDIPSLSMPEVDIDFESEDSSTTKNKPTEFADLTYAQDFNRLDISKYFNNPLLR